MTGIVDPTLSERISAYLDGALPQNERAAVELEIASDPVAAAEFEALSQVDAALDLGFRELLDRPVPLALARAIEAAPTLANQNVATGLRTMPRGVVGFRAIAASLMLLGIGAAGGALVTRAFTPGVQVAVSEPGWLDQVAEYHAVYAAQGRHLVEVPASEQEHLETWLSETTGVTFSVPNLQASGLSFEGARLLVAGGKPVAQLMYRDAAGQVVAVCFIAGGDAALAEGAPVFADRRIGAFDLISWKDREASYVVIGPAERSDLRQIAEAAQVDL